MTKRTITLKQLRKLNCDTHTVKDNSPRGVKVIPTESVKTGDEVVLDNYFIMVI